MTSTFAFILVCALGFFVLSVDSQLAPAGICCCGGGYLLIPPPSVTEECLFQHDYFSSQWTDRYNGYATAVDSCGPLDLFGGGGSYCSCSYCPDDDNDHGNFADDYRIPSTLTSYSPICGNSIEITKGFVRNCGFDFISTQVVRLVDTIPPELVVPPARTVECVSTNAVAGPDFDITNLDSYFGSARATDLCTNPFITETVGSSDSNPCNYQIRRDFVANDYCLTTPTVSQFVNFLDTTPPTLYSTNGGSVLTYTCDNFALIADTNALNIPTAIDSCDNLPNAPVPISSDIVYPGRCTGEYTIERTWTLSDTCGNAGYYVQTIVVEDPDPPVVTPVPGSNHYRTSLCTIPAPITYTVSDTCLGNTYLTYEETITGVNQFEIENHFDVIRTYKAADDCGNYVSWQDVVNVNLGDQVIGLAAQSSVTAQRGVQLTLGMSVSGNTCWDTYIFFDFGVADITTPISAPLTGCTSGNGGPTICILPPGGYSGTVFTVGITVPTSYLPDTLEIRQSSAVQNPADDHFSKNDASRTIIILTA